jgi:acetyltransferase
MEMADLFNMAEVLDSLYLPRGPRIANVTDAGGAGIMATNALLSELVGEPARISDGNADELDLYTNRTIEQG